MIDLVKTVWGVFSSPRTSWVGVAILVGIFGQFLTCVGNQFDGKPETVADWNALIGRWQEAGLALGLIFARDNKTTSEKAGAK